MIAKTYKNKTPLIGGVRALRSNEIKLVSAAGCCELFSCWHPVQITDRTPYHFLYVDYKTEADCISARKVTPNACRHKWFAGEACAQVEARAEKKEL